MQSEIGPIPFYIEPEADNTNLISWVDQHRELIEERLRSSGAISSQFSGEGTCRVPARCDHAYARADRAI